MSLFLQFTVIGVAVGAAYAIYATGLVVTNTTSGVFNFAHGAVGMLAAFGYMELQQAHVNTVLSLIIVLLVGAPLAGALVEWVFMRRLHGATAERPIMVTLGLLLILLGVGGIIWSLTNVYEVNPFVNGTFSMFGAHIGWSYLVILVVAAAVAVALWLVFYKSRIGLAMRAVVDDPDLLTMSGASPTAVSRAGWMLGFFLAALAGVVIAPTFGDGLMVPGLTLLVVNGYAAAVVGRLKSIPWAFAGGIALGLFVTYFSGYVPQHLPQEEGPEFIAVLPMIFLFVALVALPSVRLRAVGRLTTVRSPRVAGGKESVAVGTVFIIAAVIFAFCFSGQFLTAGLSTVGPVAAQTLVLGIVAVSLVLLVGYAGQVSLAQFAFMGIGAFCMGKISGGTSVLGLLLAVGVTAAVGALVALPVIRLRGLYLALATFAFAEAMEDGLFPDSHFFGPAGMEIGRITIPGLSFVGDRSEFIMLAVFFVLSALLVLAVRRSLFGRRLVAMNDSPAAYATVGLNVTFTKVAVFAISAGLAGLAGALWGGVQGIVGTTDFDIFSFVMFLLFLVIWGVRTISGAFLASLTYAIFTNVAGWSKVEGIFAGVGVVLIGRAANGILGIEWFTDRFRLPWAKPSRVATEGPEGSDIGGLGVLGGETRAAS